MPRISKLENHIGNPPALVIASHSLTNLRSTVTLHLILVPLAREQSEVEGYRTRSSNNGSVFSGKHECAVVHWFWTSIHAVLRSRSGQCKHLQLQTIVGRLSAGSGPPRGEPAVPTTVTGPKFSIMYSILQN